MDRSELLFAVVLLAIIIMLLRAVLPGRFAAAQWDVFVSYRSTNKRTVKPIVEHLKQLGVSVWVDWDAIPTEYGLLFRGRVSQGIHRSACALLFTSKGYSTSENCMEEAEFFLKRFAQTPERIIEVRLEPNTVARQLKLPQTALIEFEHYLGSDNPITERIAHDIAAQLERVRD
jgi:hypothetical protein